jgi:hypothetical protein
VCVRRAIKSGRKRPPLCRAVLDRQVNCMHDQDERIASVSSALPCGPFSLELAECGKARAFALSARCDCSIVICPTRRACLINWRLLLLSGEVQWTTYTTGFRGSIMDCALFSSFKFHKIYSHTFLHTLRSHDKREKTARIREALTSRRQGICYSSFVCVAQLHRRYLAFEC